MDTEKDELHQETTAMESVANLAPSALLILFHKVTNLHLEKKEIICSLYNVPGSGNANIDTENEDWKKVESYIKSYIYVWIINKDMDAILKKMKSKQNAQKTGESSSEDSLMLSMTEDSENSESERPSKKRKIDEKKPTKKGQKRKRNSSTKQTNSKQKVNKEGAIFEKVLSYLASADAKKYTGSSPFEIARRTVIENPQSAKLCHFCKSVKGKLCCTTEGCPDKKSIAHQKPSIRKFTIPKEEKDAFLALANAFDKESIRNDLSFKVQCGLTLSGGSKCNERQSVGISPGNFPFMIMMSAHKEKCSFGVANAT